MNVLVSGATGFVGREVVKLLLEKKHQVYALTRHEKTSENPNLHYIKWENVHTPFKLDGVKIEGVINLVGENIATSRWNNEKKKSIYNSRIDGTKTIIESLKGSELRAFVSTSAIGFYGNRKNENLTEEATSGDDFMARVCLDWESVAKESKSIASRLVILRVGLVLGKKGGMMEKLLPLFKVGFGGKLASGDQYMSWIHLTDLAKLYVDALENSDFEGTYNAVAPYPVTNKIFTTTLGKILDKKTVFSVPKIALKVVTGELSHSILSDAKVVSPKLREKKFHFRYPTLELALKEVVSKSR